MNPPSPFVWDRQPETVRCTECGESGIEAYLLDLHARFECDGDA